ncbi:unnamed protein product [Debaryomyces tyrocola]|nr:unnamed protein product [Debaryomyces tyrocola]
MSVINVRKLTVKFNSTTTVCQLHTPKDEKNLVYCNYDSAYLNDKQSIINTLIDDNCVIHSFPHAFISSVLTAPAYSISISYVINCIDDLHTLIKILASIESDLLDTNFSLEIFSYSSIFKQYIIAYAAKCLQNCKIYIH